MILGGQCWTMAAAVVLAMTSQSRAQSWRWPDASAQESVRIDNKVRFTDDHRSSSSSSGGHVHGHTHSEEMQSDPGVEPFSAPSDTQGFYNRPGEAGRYSVRVETPHRLGEYGLKLTRLRPSANADGTVDSLHAAPTESNRKPFEYYNEVDNQYALPAGPAGQMFAPEGSDRGVLVGPQGSTGVIGPLQPLSDKDTYPPILSGPAPSGLIGPQAEPSASAQRGVLVGPGGPTYVIGPNFNSRPGNRGVLVGPSGPTGMIGPQGYNSRPGVLVGPGGPTGVVGPPQSRPVLVGPGGPTGAVGPFAFNNNRQNQYSRGILVGPGGPTGSIGPGRGLLVGPGGPTGVIGPRRNDYECTHARRRRLPALAHSTAHIIRHVSNVSRTDRPEPCVLCRDPLPN